MDDVDENIKDELFAENLFEGSSFCKNEGGNELAGGARLR
jgi:hypothetical protein